MNFMMINDFGIFDGTNDKDFPKGKTELGTWDPTKFLQKEKID